MEPPVDSMGELHAADFRRRVRATAFWALIGGGLMVWFGSGGWVIPSISPIYTATATAFVWTLKIGGGVMLAVAALCLTGAGVALLFDAVACMVIALLLAVCGAVFMTNGELNGLLMLVFAVMFGAAGRQSWGAFAARPRAVGASDAAFGTDNTPSDSPRQDVVIEGHTALQALRNRRHGEPPPPASAVGPNVMHVPKPMPGEPVARPTAAPGPVADEPEDGFLAALARESEKKTEE